MTTTPCAGWRRACGRTCPDGSNGSERRERSCAPTRPRSCMATSSTTSQPRWPWRGGRPDRRRTSSCSARGRSATCPVERRRELEDVLRQLSQEIAHLSWLSAEPPGCVPGVRVPADLADDRGGTVVGVRRWRDGREVPPLTLGSCHPHGQWVDLDLARAAQPDSVASSSGETTAIQRQFVRGAGRSTRPPTQAGGIRVERRGAPPARDTRGCGGDRWTRAGCRR